MRTRLTFAEIINYYEFGFPQEKIMKIGYFADGPWAHHAFLKIIKNPEFSIQFICVRFDSVDQVLVNLATENKIPLLKLKNINTSESLSVLKNFGCDIFVSMSFNQIFKKPTFELPPLKTINCHAGKLPWYRGRNILNWVLINDEKEFGITVHYIDEGIDTGDILLQKVYPISEDDNYDTLLKIAYTECAQLLYESLMLILSDKVSRKKQCEILENGMYCGKRDVGDEIINWNLSTRQVYNFIRAICKPGPMATTSLDGDLIKINKAKYGHNVPTYIGVPGQVIGKNGLSILVKTLDSYIEITEFECQRKIKIGDRLK